MSAGPFFITSRSHHRQIDNLRKGQDSGWGIKAFYFEVPAFPESNPLAVTRMTPKPVRFPNGTDI